MKGGGSVRLALCPTLPTLVPRRLLFGFELDLEIQIQIQIQPLHAAGAIRA